MLTCTDNVHIWRNWLNQKYVRFILFDKSHDDEHQWKFSCKITLWNVWQSVSTYISVKISCLLCTNIQQPSAGGYFNYYQSIITLTCISQNWFIFLLQSLFQTLVNATLSVLIQRLVLRTHWHQNSGTRRICNKTMFTTDRRVGLMKVMAIWGPTLLSYLWSDCW